MNATMIKGERSKLLAVAIVIAMVACALVAFMPSESDAVDIPADAIDVDSDDSGDYVLDGTTAYVYSAAGLSYFAYGGTGAGTADVIVISNDIGTEADTSKYYVFTEGIEIRAADSLTPKVYGYFYIQTDGVSISGLEIHGYGYGVLAYGNIPKVEDCTFYVDKDAGNGIQIDLHGIEADVDSLIAIADNNTFKTYATAVSVYSAYDEEQKPIYEFNTVKDSIPPSDGISYIPEWNTVTIANNLINTSSEDTIIVGGNLTIQDGGSALNIYDMQILDGASVTINSKANIMGTVENNGSLTYGENSTITYGENGEVTVNSPENNGLIIKGDDSLTAEAANFDALLTAISNTEIRTVSLVGDESFVADTYITSSVGRNLTIDLNGRTLDMGTYAFNLAGITLNVTEGSTFISDGRIGYVENMKSFEGASIDIDGARLFQGVAGTDNEDDLQYSGNTLYPNYSDGVKVTKNGYWYTVCHGETVNGINIQYGAAFPDIKYDGTAHTALSSIDGFVVTSLDNYFTTATGGSGAISYDPAYADTGASEDCVNAGTYALHVTIDIIANDGSFTSLSDDLTIEIQPATPDVQISIGGNDFAWTLDAYDESTDVLGWDYTGLTVNGKPYDKASYKADGGSITYSFYQKVDGQWVLLPEIDDTNYMNLPIGEYKVEGTVSAVQNYAERTVSQEFKVLAIEIDISITNDEGTDYWGTSSDRYVGDDFKAVTETTETGKDLSISGGIYWLNDVNDADITLENGTLFGDGMDQGYYAVYYIVNNSGFDVIVTYSQDEDAKPHEIAAGHAKPMLQYLGNDITDIRADGFTIYVSATDDRGIESRSYDVDCSGLYRIATAGYLVDENAAETAINEEFTWNATSDPTGIHDVDPMTMWIAFDELGIGNATTQLTGKLYYVTGSGDDLTEELVYSTTSGLMSTGTDERIWYFTFDENSGASIGIPATPGYYKLEIWNGEKMIDYAQAYTFIEGMTGAGYEDDQGDAIAGMNGDGFPGLDDTKISPETFWIAWYEGDALDGTFAAYLKDSNGKILYDTSNENVSAWNKPGYHYWAFSKADEFPSSIKDLFNLAPGVYTLEVTYNNEVYQTAQVIVPGILIGDYDEDAAEAQKGMVGNGISDDVFTGTNAVADQTMWVVWYGQDYESVTATVTLPNEETWSQDHTDISAWLKAGIHSWYFSFDPENASAVTINEEKVPFEYGTYKFEIVADGQSYTYEMTFVDPTKYNVHINEWVTSYDDGNVRYDVNKVFSDGYAFYLPGTGFNDKNLLCWELVVDGVVVNTYDENAYIVFGDIKDKNGAPVESHDLEFRAVYDKIDVSDPAVSIDMPGTAVADGGWIYFTVTTTGDYEGLVKGFASTIDGATVQYLENAGDLAGQWVDLPIGTDGRYNFGPSDGFPFTDGATSYFRVSFENAGNYQFTVSIEDGSDVVCSASAQIVVVGTSGGDEPTEPSMPFQLDMYSIAAERVDGGIHVTISVNPELLGDYYFQLSIGRITISDYSGDSADIVRKPFLSTNPGANGIVYDGVIPCDFADGEIGVFFDGWVADEWLALGPEEEYGVVWIQAAPLLNDDYGGQGVAMTFEIVDAPADAPADNNYPWLQVNYERLEQVESVTLSVDGTPVTDITWVDENGNPIEGEPVLGGGVAFFQLSIADGDITAGVHTFTITAIAADGTEDTITMTYTVEIPGSE